MFMKNSGPEMKVVTMRVLQWWWSRCGQKTGLAMAVVKTCIVGLVWRWPWSGCTYKIAPGNGGGQDVHEIPASGDGSQNVCETIRTGHGGGQAAQNNSSLARTVVKMCMNPTRSGDGGGQDVVQRSSPAMVVGKLCVKTSDPSLAVFNMWV